MPKDVAVIQTESRTLPAKVTHIIDFNKADLSPDALKEGKKIFTIGYPSGTDMGMIDNREIHNQVHEGNVTQNCSGGEQLVRPFSTPLRINIQRVISAVQRYTWPLRPC